jgi:hypothetical protein
VFYARHFAIQVVNQLHAHLPAHTMFVNLVYNQIVFVFVFGFDGFGVVLYNCTYIMLAANVDTVAAQQVLALVQHDATRLHVNHS